MPTAEQLERWAVTGVLNRAHYWRAIEDGFVRSACGRVDNRLSLSDAGGDSVQCRNCKRSLRLRELEREATDAD